VYRAKPSAASNAGSDVRRGDEQAIMSNTTNPTFDAYAGDAKAENDEEKPAEAEDIEEQHVEEQHLEAKQVDQALVEVLDCSTIPALFRARCNLTGARTAHREKRYGIWQAYSWQHYYEQARLVGLGLIALGVERGDVVTILAEDRREWLYCDMGIGGIGAISNGVYTTDSAEQLAFLCNDSGTAILIVENDEQLDKFLAARPRLKTVKTVIVMDRGGLRDFDDEQVIFYDRLTALGADQLASEPGRFETEIDAATPDDILMLIYTSGTTGPPKGAMISHRNMLYQIAAGLEIFPGDEDDEQLCFLPLCHVFERLVSVYFQLGTGSIVNFAESVETVFDNLQEVSPHFFAAVPRLWEKIYSQVQIRRAEATMPGRWFLDQAVNSGLQVLMHREHGTRTPVGLGVKHRVLDWLVLRNIRNMLGMNRMRRGNSGAAPIAPELLRWFQAIGVELVEGYGATETSGTATANTPSDNLPGTVGRALRGSEVRIAKSGEVLVRGPHIFAGYWQQPEQTAQAIDSHGWLHTGDIGRIGNDGRLTISGRIKDILITAGGKNVTPAEIESRLKFSPFIADAVVVGDGRRYLTCLVMIDQENVEKFAQDNAVTFSDFASLCAAESVRRLIGDEIERVNEAFARVEQIKDFRLIDVLLTPEDDELTPTMKLKRGLVETKHEALITAMY
jgi:long-chain acyl-CoA synthetase